jgi:hypothetical protein
MATPDPTTASRQPTAAERGLQGRSSTRGAGDSKSLTTLTREALRELMGNSPIWETSKPHLRVPKVGVLPQRNVRSETMSVRRFRMGNGRTVINHSLVALQSLSESSNGLPQAPADRKRKG